MTILWPYNLEWRTWNLVAIDRFLKSTQRFVCSTMFQTAFNSRHNSLIELVLK